jgi:hypothetical protein
MYYISQIPKSTKQSKELLVKDEFFKLHDSRVVAEN